MSTPDRPGRHERIPETIVPGRRLGRHIWHDPRNRDYPAETAGSVVPVNHGARGLPLDQDGVGSCTAEALCAALNSDPDNAALPGSWQGHVFSQDNAFTLYRAETNAEGDPWPPNDPGGTGGAVCQAAQQLGWISSYTWAFSLQDALAALVLRPQIWGVNWYTSFDNPDPATGIITFTLDATVRGGHEICADEIDADRELIGFWNSWGSWGLNGTGKFYISFMDCERLLAEGGDVTVPLP